MSGKAQAKRPPGRMLGWIPEEGGSARLQPANSEKAGNKRVLIYLSKVKAPPTGEAKWWKNEMRRKITQVVEKELGVRVTVHGI